MYCVNTVLLDAIQLENQCEMVKLCGKYRSCVRQTGQNCYLHNNWDFVKMTFTSWYWILNINIKETMSTTMHLFTFYLESDGMSTNNDYKHFFGALSLQFC